VCTAANEDEHGRVHALETVRVVIADDHPFYRERLARLLRENGIKVVGEVGNAEAALEAVNRAGADVVIMDLRMPGLSPLQATRRLSGRAPATLVLMVSVSAEETDMADAILAGAGGYVLKDEPAEEVLAGIRLLAAGERMVSSRIATALQRRIQELAEAGADLAEVGLPAPEAEVLELLADGRHEYEIAELLGIESGAVRRRLSSILEKVESSRE
jgi:DNA-binding NarL/FixJ family response regulator